MKRVIDERWIRSLHVESIRHADLHAERAAHVLFQASTIGAVLDGAFDGDLTFAELGERGDLGLGTLNGLDGEMIALDGEFLRADVDGAVSAVGPGERTPFAVVTRFEPTIEAELPGGLEHEALLAALDDLGPEGESTFAVRLDGRWASVRARSVPKQEPPYRPLAEVVADQHVFELEDVEGTMVGFRFPTFVEGIEVAGYHLHFVDEERRRGGHVLSSRAAGLLRARIDPAADLHVELPPAVDLADPGLAAATHAAVEAVEHDG
jgi:acetolactate decarboxylase